MSENLSQEQAFKYQDDTMCVLAEFCDGEYPDDYPESALLLFDRGFRAICEPDEAVTYFELAREEALRRWKARELEQGEGSA